MTALPSASSRLLLLLCHAAAVVADQSVIIERMYSGGACSSANLYEEATFPAGRCIAATAAYRTAWGLELPWEAYVSVFLVGTQLQYCVANTQAACDQAVRLVINCGMVANTGGNAEMSAQYCYTHPGWTGSIEDGTDNKYCGHYVDVSNLYRTGQLNSERCMTLAECPECVMEGGPGTHGRVSFEITTVPSPPSPVFITESRYSHTNAIPFGESGCMADSETEYEPAFTQTNAVGECEPAGASYSQAWSLSRDFNLAETVRTSWPSLACIITHNTSTARAHSPASSTTTAHAPSSQHSTLLTD